MPLDTSLHKAAYKGDKSTVMDLITQGEDVNKRGAQNRTALHRAVSKGDDAIISMLIGANADVTLLDSGGLQAVHWSAMFGHVSSAKLLTASKADVNFLVKASGETCLHLAAEKDRAEYITFLLEELMVEKETPNKQGETAFDLAKKASAAMTLLAPAGGGCCVVM
jgi:ankyrin repeat protein